MCDILQAKMLSVIFRQQKNGVYWSVNIFMCVDSTYFPNLFWRIEKTVFTYCAPVTRAPLQLFGGRGLLDKKCSRH
jgi:hypothetical protein